MPITIHPYSSLENKEIERQLEQLYMTSPEFSNGIEAVHELKKTIGEQTLLYTAEFNTKIIAAIWCFRDEANSKRILKYIVVHPANRGRGVAQRLISEVCFMEKKHNPHTLFTPGCAEIKRILDLLSK